MHTIIISQNIQQATFIKKALYYENLGCDVVSYNNGTISRDEVAVVDGVFILMDDPSEVEIIANFCRGVKNNIPIIILPNRYNLEFDRFLNDKKVNFVFTRPFPFRQMSAEMRFAIFQQREKISIEKYVLDDLEIDLVCHQARLKEKEIYLRNKEFSLLHYLMANKGKVLSRNQILENVWDRNANVMTNTVDVHISQLRKKLGKANGRKYIRTIPCLGYIFE
jgi:two-component system, OmpR family, copper resistance phosphate regulon response regulator CusR